MLPSKAKTVFNVSHLAGNSYYLSGDVAKIHVSYVICIIEQLASKQTGYTSI